MSVVYGSGVDSLPHNREYWTIYVKTFQFVTRGKGVDYLRDYQIQNQGPAVWSELFAFLRFSVG
jgi:hypothetical protein